MQQVPPVLALRGNVLGLGSVWGSGLPGCEESEDAIWVLRSSGLLVTS